MVPRNTRVSFISGSQHQFGSPTSVHLSRPEPTRAPRGFHPSVVALATMTFYLDTCPIFKSARTGGDWPTDACGMPPLPNVRSRDPMVATQSVAICVCVTIERLQYEIHVTVRDRGMGIPPEELARLFQRFHRTPQARESGLPGTGLGLYISSGVVAAHGGRIWAESAGLGEGAAFHFTLPCDAYDPTPAAKRIRKEARGGRKQRGA